MENGRTTELGKPHDLSEAMAVHQFIVRGLECLCAKLPKIVSSNANIARKYIAIFLTDDCAIGHGDLGRVRTVYNGKEKITSGDRWSFTGMNEVHKMTGDTTG